MKTKAATPVDAMLRAVSDRTRLRILNLLRDGELCVCHIVDVLRVPQPTASRHLAYLRRARLVMARKEGLWSYYRLTPARTKFHEKLLNCLACADVPEFATDTKQVATLRKRCC
ncbi:MAG TPA: metalloregulator ArsR/SmtB family transcription factor [Pirellulales bacterium]|jgi:ArsR family transcriptional regulator